MKHKIRTIIILTSIVTVVLHILNRIQYSFTTVKNLLACSSNNYYEWRFGKVRYTKKGSGSPLLLIHDLTVGSSSYEFNKLYDSLAEEHEVFAIDLLGYGLSDKPNMTYTNYVYVQLITDFIKNVIGRKTDVIATGDAAPAIIMACHNDPEIINKMLFISPQSLYKLNQIPSKQTKALKLLIETPILGTFVYNILTNRNFIEKDFREVYFSNPLKIKEEDILTYLEASHIPDYNSKYVFASYVGRYTNTNIIHALKEINHGIYIISGEDKEDIGTIIDNYAYYNTAIESVLIPNTKHLPHLEMPEEVLKQINIFLS